MTQDCIQDLEKVRQAMVSARRELAVALAGPFDREATPKNRRQFIEVQETIEAIDRAMKDENSMQAPGIAFID